MKNGSWRVVLVNEDWFEVERREGGFIRGIWRPVQESGAPLRFDNSAAAEKWIRANAPIPSARVGRKVRTRYDPYGNDTTPFPEP